MAELGHGVLFVLAAPLHRYRQFRGTYALSRSGALARTLALLMFAGIALVLFASALAWAELTG
jgi:hypothetical protein